MMTKRKAAFSEYLVEQVSLHQEQTRTLKEDGRQDEAIFHTIQANVFDIFRVVYDVSLQIDRDDQTLAEVYLKKMRSITGNWTVAKEQAEKQQNSVAVFKETLKIETAETIFRQFQDIWEANA